ncbi:hypothetical protein L861_19275 [Litchfieldella anticariensis FP35 = DSM 16096]|uniref:Uncharacterized protein n=1 Tax=Litchfieldella anticariensis (strain DSM 16096 / CECT 5854 / CIP 108499 / LMG 22089 / FP35) TaxID=1121939 RepID=S2KNJ8_LITA3|nr:hypothetical protein [Halomonas anticariensis]EPC03677.1 hypothetical protein L861_19275 [Halomonas anticariensis FP35 = DSM 16096]
MSTSYLEIILSDDTLTKLKSSGYSLYLFLPVMSSNKSGVPLVWECRQDYLGNTKVPIPSQNIGYISTDIIDKNQTISIGSQISVACGQTLLVSPAGTLSAQANELPGIYFTSASASPRYSCGLAKQGSKGAVPYCAFDLYAALTVACIPINATFAFFATSIYDAGTYLETSLGQGIYLEMPPGGTTAATFDLDDGWHAMTAEQSSTIVPQGTKLVDILIQRPQHNKPLQLASSHSPRPK